MKSEKTMKGLVCHENGAIELMDVPVPKLKEDTDAIVRVTLSTICTSDLHIMHGAVPRAVPEKILGHEFVGEIVEVGSGVKKRQKGERVSANCITFCGECAYCRQGFINNCEKGGWELGCRIDGCQAEYVRVPFADMGLTKIPDSVSDKGALLLGDILSSGYFGAELCEIKPGDTIAVIGAGPVGLCAMSCARLFGAAQVIALDIQEERLKLAADQGLADATVNPSIEDAWKAVADLTDGYGADGVIEAAGGENTFELAWRLARPNAVVALVAMYEKAQTLPLEKMYGKNLIFKTGGVDAVHCERLMKLIEAGRINTEFLITHEAPLNDILEGYRVFENKLEHCVKWAVTPYQR
ncbi:alcohol dehydrogenase [Eubacterium sp. 1001713B170207_170306_E7]|uniref:alcohol dehydrogenase n=1 Tax=Eubacterium sp. 1001713B170207_170306_E7 TaxID=2787097 RepID=UPI001A9B0F61|nr:alcohol dehydrogenase [Eubacterium sp. 1001713B170207_170306_E7]